MADRRRRRQLNSSQEILSEGDTQQASHINLSASEHDSDEEYVDMSEFDSAEEDDDDYEESEKEEEEIVDADAVDDRKGDDKSSVKSDAEEENALSQSEKSDNVERESGDGKSDNDQEGKLSNRVLKISEEEESPYFIPTKGNFFQHDMRSENARGHGRPGNRNLNRDWNKSKWVHDKYDELEQAPKTKEEIVAEYGYDIRARKCNDQSQPVKTRSQQGRRPGRRRGLPRQQYNQGNRYPRSDRSDEPEAEEVERKNERRFPSSNRGRRNQPPIRSQNFRATRRGPTRSEHDYFEGDERSMNAADVNPKNNGKRKTYDAERKAPEPKNTPPPPKPSPKDESSSRKDQQQAKAPDHMDNVLDVINNKEQETSHRKYTRDKGYSSKRHSNKTESNLTERVKNMSLSGPKEASQPRRYSSLRQRATESPSNPPRRFPPRIPDEQNRGPSIDQPAPVDQTAVPEAATIAHALQLQPETDRQNIPIESSLDFSRLPTHQLPAYDLPSSGVSQEMADSMFAAGMQPMLNATKPEQQGVDLNDQQHWIDSALAYQESLIAQSRALMLSAALQQQQQQQQQQQPLPSQLPAPNLLLNNESEANAASQAPPISHPANQRDLGTLGSLVFPPPIPQNFPPNNFVQRNVLPERPILPPNMQMPFPPTGGLIGQQVGGVTYYPNPLQPVQNVVPVNTPVGSPMRRINAAIPIRQPMQ